MKTFKLIVEPCELDYNPLKEQDEWKFAMFHRKYNLENTDGLSIEDAKCRSKGCIAIPLSGHDHGSPRIYRGTHHAQFDGGRIGVAYREKVCCDVDELTASIDRLDELLDMYSKYLNNEGWMFKVVELVECNLGHIHEIECDWSREYYSEEHARREGEEALERVKRRMNND